MKKTLFTTILTAAILFANAQNTTVTNATQPSINVNGSAELEVVPDEIYVQIELREYKKGNTKVEIETIRNEFLSAAKKLGYTDKEISVQGYSGWDGNAINYKKKKKPNDMLAGINYWVKVTTPAKMDELVNKLDDAATTNFYIAKTSHSKIEEFKKQLKIEAIKAAKVKAQYLADAIGEKVGKAITINEPGEARIFQPMYANMAMRADAGGAEAAPAIETDFKKIKLMFDVNVVFALL